MGRATTSELDDLLPDDVLASATGLEPHERPFAAPFVQRVRADRRQLYRPRLLDFGLSQETVDAAVLGGWSHPFAGADTAEVTDHSASTHRRS